MRRLLIYKLQRLFFFILLASASAVLLTPGGCSRAELTGVWEGYLASIEQGKKQNLVIRLTMTQEGKTLKGTLTFVRDTGIDIDFIIEGKVLQNKQVIFEGKATDVNSHISFSGIYSKKKLKGTMNLFHQSFFHTINVWKGLCELAKL
jgi:hypothetical protein